jgi:iron complex outermembrane receptor protein
MKHAIAAFKGLIFGVASAAVTFGWSPVVVAQAGALEEVVVTARYREERLQDTPLAITAISAEDIEVRSFTSSYEIAYMVPNASFRPAQAAFGNTMTAFIRGIGQNDFDFAFEPGVGIYVDDVYHPFTLGSQIDLLDLERVEVLRGPQGTLFGRGSIGGAIRYVTKKAQGDNSGNITLTGGDYDRVDLRASYDFAITDNLFARVSGVSKNREGYQDVIDFPCAFPALSGTLTPQSVNRGKNCKVGTQGGEEMVGLRGTTRWVVSPTLEINVTADYQKDSSEPKADTLTAINPANVFGLLPALQSGILYDERFLPPNPYVTYATYSDPLNNLAIEKQNGLEKWTLTGRADWNMTRDITATLILAYTDLEATLATDADASPINVQTVDGRQIVDFFTAELRFSGRLWDRMDWTVGGFYYDGESTNNQMVSIPFLSLVLDGVPFNVGFPPFVNARNVHQNRNESGFAHVVYDVMDKLTLNAGIRYSHDKKSVNFDNTRVQNPFILVEDDHFDWKVGVDYKWTDDFMTYFSVSTGYRPGSYNPRPFQWTGTTAVDAEESTAYEVGFKSDWFDRKVRLNIAGFYTDWSTRIIPVGGVECLVLNAPPGPPVYATVPVGTPGSSLDSLGNNCLNTLQISRTFYDNGPGEIMGVEIEAVFRPTDALTISGAFGLTSWDSEDINDNPNILLNRPVYIPETNWTVSAQYVVPMNNGSTLTPRIDVYGQDEICTSNILTTSLFPGAGCSDSYELVNVRLEWASPGRTWIAALGATNVMDKKYFLNKFDLTAFGQPHAEGQPGAPREWYFTVQRNF